MKKLPSGYSLLWFPCRESVDHTKELPIDPRIAGDCWVIALHAQRLSEKGVGIHSNAQLAQPREEGYRKWLYDAGCLRTQRNEVLRHYGMVHVTLRSRNTYRSTWWRMERSKWKWRRRRRRRRGRRAKMNLGRRVWLIKWTDCREIGISEGVSCWCCAVELLWKGYMQSNRGRSLWVWGT